MFYAIIVTPMITKRPRLKVVDLYHDLYGEQ